MAVCKTTSEGGCTIWKNESESYLWFDSSQLSIDGVSRITNAFEKNSRLDVLRLSHCRLTDAVVQDFCSFLESNDVLEELWLDNSRFTDLGVSQIFCGLADNKSLRVFNLQHHMLSDGDAGGMANFLRKSTLETLNLKDSRFTNHGVRRILTGLIENHPLTDLNLMSSPLTDAVVDDINRFVMENSTLAVLELAYSVLNDEAMKTITEGLSVNHSLEMLCVPKARFTYLVAAPMRHFLEKNATLKQLNLMESMLDDQQMQKVLRRLSENQHLSEFSSTDYSYVTGEVKQGQSLSTVISRLEDGDFDLGKSEKKFGEAEPAEAARKQHGVKGRKAADVFFNEGGVLQLPESDVVLNVPSDTVTSGNALVIRGTVHTDLKRCSKWIPSENDHIIAPVVEYTLESRKSFKKPVEISIPHCQPAKEQINIRVFSGDGDRFVEMKKDDPNQGYVVKEDKVVIHTIHFTIFIVTSRSLFGRKEEITDAFITVAASRKEAPDKTLTSLRIMLHSGCTALRDFKHLRENCYDPDMEEISRSRVILPAHEHAIPFPNIYIELSVDEKCEATIWQERTPKLKRIKVNGKDVLRLHKNAEYRSERLADFHLDDKSHQQLQCSIKASFQYEKNKVVEEIRVVYPLKYPVRMGTETEERKGRNISLEEDLTHEKMVQSIKENRPEIYTRLDPSDLLIAHLEAVDVIGVAAKNDLNAEGMTGFKRTEIIMNSVLKKGTKAFMDFCLVLGKDDIDQSYIVTEVMGLDLDYIRAQRAYSETPVTSPVQPAPKETLKQQHLNATTEHARATFTVCDSAPEMPEHGETFSTHTNSTSKVHQGKKGSEISQVNQFTLEHTLPNRGKSFCEPLVSQNTLAHTPLKHRNSFSDIPVRQTNSTHTFPKQQESFSDPPVSQGTATHMLSQQRKSSRDFPFSQRPSATKSSPSKQMHIASARHTATESSPHIQAECLPRSRVRVAQDKEQPKSTEGEDPKYEEMVEFSGLNQPDVDETHKSEYQQEGTHGTIIDESASETTLLLVQVKQSHRRCCRCILL